MMLREMMLVDRNRRRVPVAIRKTRRSVLILLLLNTAGQRPRWTKSNCQMAKLVDQLVVLFTTDEIVLVVVTSSGNLRCDALEYR